MSEYQYYEFQAIDRSLSKEQMAELRAISSRAEITPTRFTNVYSYGDFRGDPSDLIARYFDAHVYIANWGSHVLIFGIPGKAVDLKTLQAYQAEGGFVVQARGERVIVTFESQDEDGGGWVDDDEGAGWMGSLVSLRAEIMNGDLRAAYLGWLRGVQAEGLDVEVFEDDDVEAPADDDDEEGDGACGSQLEPPVPPGLRSLTGPLESLVEFLELDEDLVAVAAEASEPLAETGPSARALKEWIGDLPASEKDSLLVRLMQGDTQLQPELRRRFRDATAPRGQTTTSKRRTVRQLFESSAARSEERKRLKAEAAGKERVRRAEEAARARDARLKSMIGRENELWRQTEELIGTKQQNNYDRAVQILVDLRDLAAREGTSAAFGNRVNALRASQSSKPSLMRRLDKARLV
jgi:hypothetical protein